MNDKRENFIIQYSATKKMFYALVAGKPEWTDNIQDAAQFESRYAAKQRRKRAEMHPSTVVLPMNEAHLV